jgi:hypothetical protein
MHTMHHIDLGLGDAELDEVSAAPLKGGLIHNVLKAFM